MRRGRGMDRVVEEAVIQVRELAGELVVKKGIVNNATKRRIR